MVRVLAAAFLIIVSVSAAAGQTIDYWDSEVRRGGNSFNGDPPSQAYFDALAATGADWVRLSFTKWESTGDGAFLIGDPGAYDGLVEGDLAILVATLDRAHASGLGVVVTPLSLPGSVWSQHNGDEIDDRIYSDKAYWGQAARFWADLASALREHPGVVAYNLLNEPTPERPSGFEGGTPQEIAAWYEDHQGTARDLPALTQHLVDAIRTVDADTPVMVDGGFYAAPHGFSYFPAAIDGEAILYAFHMYEPWAATSMWNVRNGSKLTYPGEMTIWGETQEWDAARVERTLQQPLDWAGSVGVPASRIVLGEFGCVRRIEWCPTYLDDVLTAAEADGLHWAFYSFREDVWDGMDYELGTGPVPEGYWKAMEAGTLDDWPRTDGSVFAPIRRRLERN